jgi:hypothetical protein
LAGYDIILLCETFAKEFPTVLFPSFDIIVSPGVRVTDGVTSRLSGGIALMVRKTLAPFVNRIYVEYDNVIVLRLAKELTGLTSECVLVGVYIPPPNSVYYKETEIENGIYLLEQCILDLYEEYGEVPLLVFGDLNARTGCTNARVTYLSDYYLDEDNEHVEEYKRLSKDSVINDCGRCLLNVCEQFSLLIMNGVLPGDRCGNVTYIAHNGASVIDYFLISRSLVNRALNLRVVPRIDSKHLPVEMIFNTMKTHGATPVNPVIVNIQKYVWDQDKVETYHKLLMSTEVSSIFDQASVLIEIDTEAALEKFYEGLFLAGQCMNRTFKVGKVKSNPWFDVECRDKRSDLRQALRKYTTLRSGNKQEADLLRIKYSDKRREYKSLLKQKKADHKKQIIQTLEVSGKDSKKFWGTIKSAMQHATIPNTIPKDDWFEHFKKVFESEFIDQNEMDDYNDAENEANFEENVEEPMLDCAALDAYITELEVENAIKALKLGKAAGPDGLGGEFYKYSLPCVVQFLTTFFNKLFDSGSFPLKWSESIIHPLHKKGDIDSPDNYRGISLVNTCSKLYSYILNTRLTSYVEDNALLNEAQAGFRRGYSTIDHIFTLLTLVQKQLLNHSKLYAAFIDFKKAFDFVNRERLWVALRKKGIQGKMYRAIKSMYDSVKARVRINNDITEPFMCPRGLKQGENCSPILFALLINELADDIEKNGKHGITLSPYFIQILILLFADDVILLSNTVVGLQRQLNLLSNSVNTLNLTVNREKSKVIIFRNGGHIASAEKWFYEGERLEIVNTYKYLGITFSTGLTFSYSLSEMAAKAKKSVFGILKFLWSMGENSPSLFFKLFDCQIQPMLTYGAEVWGLKADHTTIERVHLFAIKRLLNVSIITPTALIYCETGRYPLYIQTHAKCLKYWLKITRMDEDRIPKLSYNMLLSLHCKNKRNWATDICYTLYRYGFGYVWENQGVEDVNRFILAFKQRLFDCHLQDLDSNIGSNERYALYTTFRQLHDVPQYLYSIRNPALRKVLVRVRLGVSQLKTHQLRYSKEHANMICPFCKTVEENEIHFILICPEYKMLRDLYIPDKYVAYPNAFKLSLLLADTRNSTQLALFLSKAFMHRNALICHV